MSALGCDKVARKRKVTHAWPINYYYSERDDAVHTHLFLFSYLLFTFLTLNITISVFRATHNVEHWNSTLIAAQSTELSFASTR
ncbi:hypothetical protein [Diadegma fenestrale ichnovirus]|nr:hypothetical protein [Diadegma fenestrale ichnovirus]